MPAPLNLSKEQTEKMVLMGIGVFVFVMVLFQFVMVPSLRKLGELNTEIGRLRENLKKSQALITNKAQMENRLAVLQQKLKDYKTALPPYSDMPNILQNISNIASETKVKIIKIEPLKAEQQPAAVPGAVKPQGKPEPGKAGLLYTEIPIKIEARGGYHALGEFIGEIEASKNIMAIGDLEIDASPDDMFSHNARLLIVAYVLREEMPAK
jgi:Tfp pilus assembly protein PilO